MTLLVFSSIIFSVLLVLKSEISYLSSSSSYSDLHQYKLSGNINNSSKMEEQDGIIIFAYVIIAFGIILPNLDQID
jgi:hypothetical protein